MQCPSCNTINDNENTFCVNCGLTISGSPTVRMDTAPNAQNFPQADRRARDAPSVQTPFVQQSVPTFDQPNIAAPKKRKWIWLLVITGVLGVLLIFGGVAAVFLLRSTVPPGDVLPDHLGMFYQNKEKTQLSELRKLASPSVLDAKNELAKDESLPVVDEHPEMILYADGTEIPIADVKLIPLDSVNIDGTMKQIDFQASPVDGKPAMKRLKFADSLAIGKYAFAIFDGYFDDGKHKFWAFEIKTAQKKDNGDLARNTVVAMRPKQIANTTSQKVVSPNLPVAPPSAGNMARSVTRDLVLRSGPGQGYPKIRNLAYQEQVYILGYSSNTESFKGRASPFAQVRTLDGQVGWVFSAYLR